MNSVTRFIWVVGGIGLLGCGMVMAQPGPTNRPLAPAHTAMAPLALMGDGPSVTRWGSGRASALGVSLGVQGNPFLSPPGTASVGEALQLGLHWRGDLPGRWQWRLSGWADWSGVGMGAWQPGAHHGANGTTYAAQVEVQWQSARRGGLIPEYGAIGVQLQSGSRLMLRARHGGPMIYYRTRF